MKRKIVIPLVAITVVLALVIVLAFLAIPHYIGPAPGRGFRKAIILCSANDFYPYEAEEDYNGGEDSNLNGDSGFWVPAGSGATPGYNATYGHDAPGSLFVQIDAPDVQFNYTYDWDLHQTLTEYAFYNISAWFQIQGWLPTTGGAKVGLQWLDSIGTTVRTDWSPLLTPILDNWTIINIEGVCNNDTNNEITDLNLVFAIEAIFPEGSKVFFDDIKVDKWIAVNNTNPTDPNPPPSRIDSDGFPAQALHVYWILKSHGYTDDHIFLMIYHTNDNVIDIKKNDSIANDLIGAVIDVENDDVNSSRFKHELNVSISGSFASGIIPKDQLIIFMTDHGSNAVLGDGNATFHFEADNSFITEFEFYDLVKEIDCERMMINVDSCFSGNFLNSNKNIGLSWYDIPNCLFVSTSSNVFSWYWISNNNGDGFAGSWFFHQFWEQLDQNQTISNAFFFAVNFIPWNQFMPLIATQMPLLYDNMGINTTLSFNSDPPL